MDKVATNPKLLVKSHRVRNIALIVLAIALAIVWMIQLSDLPSPLWLRAFAAVGSTLLAALTLKLVLSQNSGGAEAARQYVEMLCGMESEKSHDGQNFDNLPPPKCNEQWLNVFNRVKDCIQGYGRRVVDSEHARTKAEVRARRLQAENEQLNEVLASLPEPVVAFSQYDELLLANTAAQKALNLKPGSTEKRANELLAHCDKLLDLLNDTRRRKGPVQRSNEVELGDHDGVRRWYNVTVRNLGSEAAGKECSQGTVAFLRDVSTQKVLQKRNAEFVSAVSHEMKTPLAGIKAYVELLADGDAEDEATREEFLSIINGQTDRLQRLIDNLLNLARIEAGVVDVHKEPRSLNDILEEAFRVIQPSADQKGIQLASDLSPMYLGVLADRDMLLQAAINLLSNAVKYTPHNGKVTLRSRLLGNEAMFEVEDSGVGLAPEDCEKVFEKFYRVKKDQQMASGTGLGLPLAKHIVEDVHSGRLTVTSVLGQGSTFRICLPTSAASKS